MTKLSQYFSRHEFACKCGCGQDTVDAELITLLGRIRIYFGQPVTINSGNRCIDYNKSVGGAIHSQHLLSRAADITVRSVEPSVVYNWMNTWHRGGLGRYNTFTHIDSRADKTRW